MRPRREPIKDGGRKLGHTTVLITAFPAQARPVILQFPTLQAAAFAMIRPRKWQPKSWQLSDPFALVQGLA